MKKLAIIGGGAAGLVAAICASEVAQLYGDGQMLVTVYEANDRVGRSILVTGNGRCNFSNASIDSTLYHNAHFVSKVLDSLESSDAIEALCLPVRHMLGECTNVVQRFFAGLGLAWSQESQGRLYPYANKASSVLDVLRAALQNLNVEQRLGAQVARIERNDDGQHRFVLRMQDGSFERADAVIVAAGGKCCLELLGSLCKTRNFRLVLGPLKTDVAPIRGLDNIRVHAGITISDCANNVKAIEVGELLFRKYGVSGIAVFNLSRFACLGDVLHVDFFPQLDETCLRESLFVRRKTLICQGVEPRVEEFFNGLVLPLVAEAVWKYAGLTGSDFVDKHAVQKFAKVLKNFELTIEGVGDPKQCQVHRGGVVVDDVDPSTLELARCSGLFVAGEVLDVDGPCGGYNLHWAWASGMLAGMCATQKIL